MIDDEQQSSFFPFAHIAHPHHQIFLFYNSRELQSCYEIYTTIFPSFTLRCLKSSTWFCLGDAFAEIGIAGWSRVLEVNNNFYGLQKVSQQSNVCYICQVVRGLSGTNSAANRSSLSHDDNVEMIVSNNSTVVMIYDEPVNQLQDKTINNNSQQSHNAPAAARVKLGSRSRSIAFLKTYKVRYQKHHYNIFVQKPAKAASYM